MTDDPSSAAAPLASLPPEILFPILATATALMALEYAAARFEGRRSHALGETLATAFIAVGGVAAKALGAGLTAVPYVFVAERRLFDIAIDGVLPLLALFVAVEFCYYWMHRAAHTVRWMWATHRVHHSPTKLNLTAALRLGWTGPISGNPLFFLPLAWLGFPPLAIIAALAVNLAYQFLLHTEREVRLGPLEWIFNTPTHHRVHHASNDSCLDKNFGGVLIIFDRMFGTFAAPAEGETLRYGLKSAPPTDNPFRILFDEWRALLRDAASARTPSAFAWALFGRPGAGGDGATAAVPPAARLAPLHRCDGGLENGGSGRPETLPSLRPRSS